MATPELEMMFEIWTGPDHTEVGLDRDGIGLIEIRQYGEDDRKCHSRVSFSKSEVPLLVQALTRLVPPTVQET